ncbi:MAG: hypothetical protein WC869_06610 [Phycisphaerae bacterium]|jgi:hypothetical protein
MATAVKRAPWTTGSCLASQHYVVYCTTNNRALETFLPGFMEAAYDNYLALTCLSERRLKEPLPIYLMGTRAEWASLTTSVVGANAKTYLALQAGGYCYQGVCVFWDIGNLPTFTVASHEGFHQFLHHRLADRLPMWLEEGMCTVAEGYDLSEDHVTFTADRNVLRFSDLRNAIVAGKWIPLGKLLPMDAGDAVVGSNVEAVGYYGQLWALQQFIRSRPDYKAGLTRLLADAEKGKLNTAMGMTAPQLAQLRSNGKAYNQTVSPVLFRQYICSDLAGFERDYFAYAKKIARL